MKLVEKRNAYTESSQRNVQLNPHDEEFRAALNDEVQYNSGSIDYLTAIYRTLFEARLIFADAALSAGCVDLADKEYRTVLNHGNKDLSSRAMVGIQDVRDLRGARPIVGTSPLQTDICTNGKPRHWSQSVESCRSQ